MAAALPLVEILGSDLLAEVGGTAGISKLANTLFSGGAKKSAEQILKKAGKLLETQKGRDKLLKGIGQGADTAFNFANRVTNVLQASPFAKKLQADKIANALNRGHKGFQNAIGKISKVGKSFGFI